MNKKTPVLCQDGYASMVLEYVEDERGTAELARFLDEEGQPVVNRQLKVVSIVRRYEPDQHRSTLTFLDENGDEVNGPSRFSRLVSQYDDQGLKEWQSNWDQQGVLLGAVIHHYDAEGQLRTTDYFSDEQFSNRMGRHVHEYNQIGRCDSERMFGADGTTLLWSTFREFTQDGRPTKVAHFDGKGDPWRCREGYTQVECEYSDDGSLAKQVETGYDGSGGFTKIVREFDAENAPTQVRHFNHGVLVEPQNKTPLQSPSG